MSNLIWELVTDAPRADAAWWYAKARSVGVQVHHRAGEKCSDFDSVAGAPGVFRRVGSIAFDKRARRWHVRAFEDCDAQGLCAVIKVGVVMAERHGQRPGHGLRDRAWHHEAIGFNGHPTAAAWVSCHLSLDDLLAPARVDERVPTSPEALATSSDFEPRNEVSA